MWAEDRDLLRITEAALNPFSRTELCTRCALGDAMRRHIWGFNLPLGGNPVIQIVPFFDIGMTEEAGKAELGHFYGYHGRRAWPNRAEDCSIQIKHF